jgi:hypothetical protein
MSNAEFQNYLALIGKLLQLTRQQREAIGLELQDHLDSRVADLMELGVDRNEAIGQALEEFGDAALMAKNLQFVSQIKRRRWMMRIATFSIAGSFLVAVLTMAMWPENARFGGPDRSHAQVDKQDPADALSPNRLAIPNQEGSPSAGLIGGDPDQSATGGATIFSLNKKIEQALKKTVDLDYQEMPWSEVQSDLSERFQINLITDQTALDDALAPDTLITSKFSDLPLEVCLKHMLNRANATFVVRDGILLVISMDYCNGPRFLTLRSFDCRALIEKLSLQQSSRKFERLDALGTGVGMGGLGGGGMFRAVQEGTHSAQATSPSSSASQGGGPVGSGAGSGAIGGQPFPANLTILPSHASSPQNKQSFRVVETPEDLLTSLVMLMTDEVEKWEQIGSVKVVNGCLIVRNTRDAIQEVEVFLNLLDESLRQ